MRHKKHRGHFWRNWSEAQNEAEDMYPDPRAAWHTFFANFLGMPPEEHWLFSGRRFKPWASGHLAPPGLFNPFVAEVLSKGGGLLSLYVLHLLAEKPRYGNDIMREIESRTQGQWGANPGAIYPLLTAMEDSGLVVGKWQDPHKRTRRIYSLTNEGHQELARLKEVMRPKLEEAISVLSNFYKDLSIDEE